ncbi:MAG: methylcobamide--CoM methyltransferase [Synergistaceae bacterium]|jgi:[methyl-Co(III) methanol-specific corrinoid protein]:coenzyme M methyltransferase|nr:methylcobamide--CoM methyltransferase [Synergistaceae bacterium]
MTDISPKERLARVLDRETADRPPVICPGGMMNAAVVDVMKKGGHTLPEAHHDDRMMASLAEDVNEFTGFENYGLPFCMTVEAEVLGSAINFGTLGCEPKIREERYASAGSVERLNIRTALESGRVGTVTRAVHYLAGKHGDIPVIGNLTGPVSTAASIVEPMTFLKGLIKDRDNSARLLDYVTDFLIAYGCALIESGASFISIADPTATGEIMGPASFKKYAVPCLNRLVGALNEAGARVIVHICGDIRTVRQYIPEIRSQAISTDAVVNLKKLKDDYPQLVTMGNVSTYALEFQTPENIVEQTGRLVRESVDIVAPACGLSTSSPIENIRAMTKTVKESRVLTS